MKFAKKHMAVSAILILSLIVTACSFPGKKENPEASPEVTETPSPYEEDAGSNLGLWARAMGSILMYMNEGNVYYFGGYEINEYNTDAAKKILEQSWSIKNRKHLLKQIKSLIKGQQHTEYLEVAKEVNSYTAKELEQILSQLPETTRLYYSLVQYNWEKWQKNGVLAWDLCRVSHLVQWGFLAGYITIDEAQALIEPAARKLQKKFTSWEEVQMNWLDGYAWWAEINMDEADNEYLNRKAIYEEIVANQETEGLLYDDSLFEKEIVPLEGISYKDLFAEVKSQKSKAATGSALGNATGSAIKNKKSKKATGSSVTTSEDGEEAADMEGNE